MAYMCAWAGTQLVQFFALGSSKIEVSGIHFFDIVTTHNNHPSLDAHTVSACPPWLRVNPQPLERTGTSVEDGEVSPMSPAREYSRMDSSMISEQDLPDGVDFEEFDALVETEGDKAYEQVQGFTGIRIVSPGPGQPEIWGWGGSGAPGWWIEKMSSQVQEPIFFVFTRC